MARPSWSIKRWRLRRLRLGQHLEAEPGSSWNGQAVHGCGIAVGRLKCARNLETRVPVYVRAAVLRSATTRRTSASLRTVGRQLVQGRAAGVRAVRARHAPPAAGGWGGDGGAGGAASGGSAGGGDEPVPARVPERRGMRAPGPSVASSSRPDLRHRVPAGEREGSCGAVRARNGYLVAQYHRIARRRGDKTAITAVGHSILVIAWHLLRNGGSYRNLGHEYFDRLDRDRLVRYHTRRLAELGVVLPPPSPASAAS